MAAKIGKLTPQANAATAASTAAAFYAVAMERSIELPTQNYAAGNTLNFSLPPSGIGTYVTVSFKGTLTVTSGATVSQPTASPWYPYNILNIAYSDYLAFPRCNASGWQLKELEMMRAFQFDPANVYGVTPQTAQTNGTASISSAAAAVSFANQVPTAVASSSPTEPIAFSFIVPISTSKNTVKGSHLFNITGAVDTLGVVCNPATGAANAADAPLTVPVPADTQCSISGTVDVCYYYMDWPAGAQVPTNELLLAHQVNSITQTQNINAGTLYQFLVPTGFIYSRFITQFVNGGVPDTTDITQVSFYLDANTPVHTENLQPYLRRIISTYGHQFPDGAFITDLSTRPVNSNSYSQVAINLQLNNTIVTSSPFMRTLSDALTLQNQNLQALGAQG
jgi:hypothetical protein